MRGWWLWWLLCALPVHAHDLHHAVERGEAVTVSFRFPGAEALSYEQYELFRPGETIPFQVGRSDGLGRVTFVPDRDGEWRLRIFTEDGHGADIKVAALAGAGTPGAAAVPRYVLIGAGVGWIFGLFGLWAVYTRRKEST
ncbi:hypothetical protein [Sulfurivermis fontis]|uniref:hypothetical protein n=1 Tax=Sulfurivermis fontis TaxID=1972068 RepID=UPI000FD919D0|nr:hypothetical protein [Sulfurivermis fontis]